MTIKITNREDWLNKLANALQKEFKPEGLTMPSYRITVGFPSKGGLATKNRTIGQCWSPSASADETTEIILSITQDDDMKVAGVVAHEMVHAVVGVEHGHKKPFRDMATAIGLTGKMTATTEGDRFIERVTPILNKLGPFPHKKLDANVGRKKQTTRMVKVTCLAHECGMVFRTSNKWIEKSGGDMACPICAAPTKIG